MPDLYIFLTIGKSACWIAGSDDLLKAAIIGGMEVRLTRQTVWPDLAT